MIERDLTDANAHMVYEPRIRLKQRVARRDITGADWQISWALKNLCADSLQLRSVRFPHQEFKAEEIRFEPHLDLPADREMEFAAHIVCDKLEGLVTENAFAILYVNWCGESWRIFVRLKVVVESGGTPVATTEAVTTQRAGFSGVES
jgi:hypothetical protein